MISIQNLQKILLFLSVYFVSCISVQCPSTNFRFTSKYTLGQQDQLNKTFTIMQKNLTQLDDVVYKPDSDAKFTITKAKTTLRYLDSKQKATVKGDSTIIIDGGYLQATIQFQWIKESLYYKTGTAKVQGKSNEIIFAKQFVVADNASYSYKLLDSFPIEWRKDSFRLNRIDPPQTTTIDQEILIKMVNQLDGDKDLKSQLERQLQKGFNSVLQTCLHDEHQPIQAEFQYKWQPFHSNKSISINFKRRPTGVDLQKQGLYAPFDVQIANDPKWQCSKKKIPFLPLDIQQYGGAQQFISLGFYQNLVRYAVEIKYLNTELNRKNWQSRMFQFYAGDLYQVFPKLQTKFYASEPVQGKCEATMDKFSLVKNTKDTFNVTLTYICSLSVGSQNFVTFQSLLTLSIAGIAKEKSLDFRVHSHSHSTVIRPSSGYIMEKPQLAQAMISHSLNRLLHYQTFGSGWPLSPPRDYPHFSVAQNYTLIYDSSQLS